MKSDQGTEYKNEILDQICKLLQIKQNFATAYHPQTMGSLERNHRCLNEYLRSFASEHHADWDDWIQFYAFNYHSTPHTDHGYTPYELVFGVKPITPNLPCLKTGIIDPIYNFDLYSKELKYKLQTTYKIAAERLLHQKLLRKQILDSTANPLNIVTGDKVYLKIENRHKLDSMYNGPYTVKSISNPNCEITNIQTNQTFTVHKNRLIKV